MGLIDLATKSYLDVVEAFKVQSRYGGDAAMDQVNVLNTKATLAYVK